MRHNQILGCVAFKISSNRGCPHICVIIFILIGCFQPWEPQCFLRDFHYDIVCGDSWGDKLLVATNNGTYVLEGKSFKLLILYNTQIMYNV